MPIYMKVEGVDGDVTAEGHDKWIELQSFQLGVGRHIGSPTGRHAEREAAAPSISEIVVTKTSDVSSAKLFQQTLWGEGVKVQIDFCKTDKDKLEIYDQYELEQVLFSNMSVSSGGERPMESLALNFTKIIFTHTAMGSANEAGSPEKVGYDLAKAKSI
jgi:type VI secretion system secreted protein Hcp